MGENIGKFLAIGVVVLFLGTSVVPGQLMEKRSPDIINAQATAPSNAPLSGGQG